VSANTIDSCVVPEKATCVVPEKKAEHSADNNAIFHRK